MPKEIFSQVYMKLPQLKQILTALIQGALECRTPLSVPIYDLFEATWVVADVGSTGIQLDWLDKGIKKIQE